MSWTRKPCPVLVCLSREKSAIICMIQGRNFTVGVARLGCFVLHDTELRPVVCGDCVTRGDGGRAGCW